MVRLTDSVLSRVLHRSNPLGNKESQHGGTTGACFQQIMLGLELPQPQGFPSEGLSADPDGSEVGELLSPWAEGSKLDTHSKQMILQWLNLDY